MRKHVELFASPRNYRFLNICKTSVYCSMYIVLITLFLNNFISTFT